jgi:magnesium transporter
MDAFASIISNNLNIVMKMLTSITILMAIPTMISSFYGMNVTHLPVPVFWFPIVLSIVVTLIVAIILVKTKMFK